LKKSINAFRPVVTVDTKFSGIVETDGMRIHTAESIMGFIFDVVKNGKSIREPKYYIKCRMFEN